ncbi:MAG TPA: DNA-binding domain-containing protein, partial [Burkholderiaceae bacterium]
MNLGARQREMLRQQQLLRALWQRGPAPSLTLWLRESGERAGHALAAYRGNASAIAERALASAYPTVQQLLGDESFTHVARALWHHAPPQRGDLAYWGDALPGWIERDPQLAEEPYLADVARVDWAVHTVEQAADVEPPAAGITLLAEHDPAQLRLRLRPGLTLVSSRWPVVTI